jgi:hypothetical protein
MCDFSLESFVSRAAEKGDRLFLYRFSTTTIGMRRQYDHASCPTCVKPGTELGFDVPITLENGVVLRHSTATFVQLEVAHRCQHRDAIETPDGQQFLLQNLLPGQTLSVLQIPAERTQDEVWEALTAPPKQDTYKALTEMTREVARKSLRDQRPLHYAVDPR